MPVEHGSNTNINCIAGAICWSKPIPKSHASIAPAKSGDFPTTCSLVEKRGSRGQCSVFSVQCSGVRGQGSGVRGQESGVRSQESGVRSQEQEVTAEPVGRRGIARGQWAPNRFV